LKTTASPFLVAAIALLTVTALMAGPSNVPPPTGAILDLNGQPISFAFQQYTVDFTATLTNTTFTFAFRDDPSWISFENASVADLTHPSGNLLVNGDFSGATYNAGSENSYPTGWTYTDPYGTGGGTVDTDCGGPQASGICWSDGAIQAYDALSQSIGTTVGDTYQVSFWVSEGSEQSTFSAVSTNGDTTDEHGNGIDVLAYAQSGVPPLATPEPASLLLVVAGAAVLGLRRRLVS